jgi:Rrf2 family protein
LRLTSASEHACLALLAIAERQPDWCKRREISERFDASTAFLEQILRRLTADGLVVARRGADGGFRLGRPAGAITIADIVRAMDGPLAPTRSVSENYYHPSPLESSTALHSLFREVRDAIALILERTTLEDIVEREHKARRRNGKRDRRVSRGTARAN